MKTTSFDHEIISFSATRADGTVVEYRRCGAIPDIFADADGNLLRLQKATTFSIYGNSSVKYRNTSLSVRSLVADAWIPGWRHEFDSIAVVDGDKTNVKAVNLRPVNGGRGRPPGDSEIAKLAEIYQLYKICPDVLAIVKELKVKAKVVYAALGEFDPELLKRAKEAEDARRARGEDADGGGG